MMNPATIFINMLYMNLVTGSVLDRMTSYSVNILYRYPAYIRSRRILNHQKSWICGTSRNSTPLPRYPVYMGPRGILHHQPDILNMWDLEEFYITIQISCIYRISRNSTSPPKYPVYMGPRGIIHHQPDILNMWDLEEFYITNQISCIYKISRNSTSLTRYLVYMGPQGNLHYHPLNLKAEIYRISNKDALSSLRRVLLYLLSRIFSELDESTLTAFYYIYVLSQDISYCITAVLLAVYGNGYADNNTDTWKSPNMFHFI